jgi:methylmalonyl-CoA mutase C-terminal domain/subunit
MSSQRTVRCLVAKVGLDGHDRGAHVIARAFRDAGFEVIYSGLHNTPEEIVQAAVQEDVDVLGVSILSGAHNTLVPKIVDGLHEYGAAEDTLFLVGGIVPEEDRDRASRWRISSSSSARTPPSGDRDIGPNRIFAEQYEYRAHKLCLNQI